MEVTTEQIEAALFNHFFLQSDLVTFRISGCSGIINHECDCLIINKNGYLVEYEIKISLSDLKKDLQKPHQHKDNRLRAVNFIVPCFLEKHAFEILPEHFGIWVCRDLYTIERKRRAKINSNASPLTDKEKLKFFRLDGLKKGLLLNKIALNQMYEQFIVENHKLFDEWKNAKE